MGAQAAVFLTHSFFRGCCYIIVCLPHIDFLFLESVFCSHRKTFIMNNVYSSDMSALGPQLTQREELNRSYFYDNQYIF